MQNADDHNSIRHWTIVDRIAAVEIDTEPRRKVVTHGASEGKLAWRRETLLQCGEKTRGNFLGSFRG